MNDGKILIKGGFCSQTVAAKNIRLKCCARSVAPFVKTPEAPLTGIERAAKAFNALVRK